ncbi:MAG: hypothetical protein ACM3PE_07225, partial [Deltaproteobacteria bacterium]
PSAVHDAAGAAGPVPIMPGGGLGTVARVSIVVPGASAFFPGDITTSVVSGNTFSVYINSITNVGMDGVFYILFSDMDCSSFTGPFNVNMTASPGGVFTSKVITITP